MGDEPLSKPSLHGFNVLVVEDDLDTQEAVRLVLERAGAAVTTAGSAPDALKAFLTRPPDVLVCDLGLPGVDGYAFIRQIRDLPLVLGGRIAALALTAYSAEAPTKVLHAGFQAYLTKPVEPSELVSTVASLALKARQ
jgi:CheY-like chemotaxis protein